MKNNKITGSLLLWGGLMLSIALHVLLFISSITKHSHDSFGHWRIWVERYGILNPYDFDTSYPVRRLKICSYKSSQSSKASRETQIEMLGDVREKNRERRATV